MTNLNSKNFTWMEPRLKNNRPFWVRWYKTAAWQRLRMRQLKKKPFCEFCKNKNILTEADTVDHIVPHKGDMKLFFDPENLQSLDKKCHSSAKQRLEKKGEFGCDEHGIVPSWR